MRGLLLALELSCPGVLCTFVFYPDASEASIKIFWDFGLYRIFKSRSPWVRGPPARMSQSMPHTIGCKGWARPRPSPALRPTLPALTRGSALYFISKWLGAKDMRTGGPRTQPTHRGHAPRTGADGAIRVIWEKQLDCAPQRGRRMRALLCIFFKDVKY